jgi:hypothetical protein
MVMTGVVCGIVAASAAGTFLWVRNRRTRTHAVLTCRCAGCGQKMRYPATRSGRGGICPRCGRRWILPANAQELPTAVRPRRGRQQRIGRRMGLSGSTPHWIRD